MLFCYDTSTGKPVSHVTVTDANNDRLSFYRLGWFGDEHFFLCWHDGDVQLFRAADGAAIATMRHQFGGTNVIGAPDGRFWYCPRAGQNNTTLIGIPFPAALRGEAPAQPYRLTLAPEGLLGSVPAATSYDHLFRKSPGGMQILQNNPRKQIWDTAFTADYERLLVGRNQVTRPGSWYSG
jgi:hypothetical protein